jgi:hypothetical protein
MRAYDSSLGLQSECSKSCGMWILANKMELEKLAITHKMRGETLRRHANNTIGHLLEKQKKSEGKKKEKTNYTVTSRRSPNPAKPGGDAHTKTRSASPPRPKEPVLCTRLESRHLRAMALSSIAGDVIGRLASRGGGPIAGPRRRAPPPPPAAARWPRRRR